MVIPLAVSFSHVVMLQGAGSETSIQTIAVISLPVLVILGWLVAVGMTGVGRAQNKPKLVSSGVMGVGSMTIVTPFVFYLYETFRLEGVYPATAIDFLLVGFLSSVGSVTIAYGALWFRGRKIPA